MGETPDPDAFETYPPRTNIPHREQEYAEVADILSTPGSKNAYLYGPRGTGKTLLIRRVLDDLSDSVTTCYIPCIRYDTQYKILQRLHRCLSGETLNNGYHTAQLQDRIDQLIDSTEGVLVLDEVDFLLANDGNSLLYYLSRIAQADTLHIIGISANHPDFEAVIDDRVYSSLQPDHVHFTPYTPDEAEDILRARVQRLLPHVPVERDAIGTITAATTNMQLGIHWLARAADAADDAITSDLVDTVRQDAIQLYWDVLLQDFTQHHHLLLEAINQLWTEDKKEEVHSGEVYERYEEICSTTGNDPVSNRRCGDFLNHLELLGIINAERHYGGEQGKTRSIQLSHPI